MDFLYSTVTSVLTRVRTSLLPDVLSSKPMTTPEETATSPLSASEQQEVPQKKDAFHEALWQTLQEKQYRGTIHASHPVHTLSPCPKVNPGFQVATAPAISNKTPIPVFDLPLLDSESGSGVSESDAEDYEHEEMESIQVFLLNYCYKAFSNRL